jgi:truncated hemoglobin YjbI
MFNRQYIHIISENFLSQTKQALFESYGGRAILEKVSKVFYDKIYEDAWLKGFFQHVPQEYIEAQQVDFMQTALGGENVFAGKTPPHAHKHIYITDDVYRAREKLLLDSLKECFASVSLIARWIEIEDAFYGRVVKSSIDECEVRYPGEGILDFPKP